MQWDHGGKIVYNAGNEFNITSGNMRLCWTVFQGWCLSKKLGRGAIFNLKTGCWWKQLPTNTTLSWFLFCSEVYSHVLFDWWVGWVYKSLSTNDWAKDGQDIWKAEIRAETVGPSGWNRRAECHLHSSIVWEAIWCLNDSVNGEEKRTKHWTLRHPSV